MVCPKQRPLRRTTCTDIVATAKAGTLSFCVTRRKRRPLTEFRKLAAKAARKCRRPAPHHKHPVLRGPNREIIQAERSPRSLVLSSTRLFPGAAPQAPSASRTESGDFSSRASTHVTRALLNTTLPLLNTPLPFPGRVGGRKVLPEPQH